MQKTIVIVAGIFGIRYEWQPLRKTAEAMGFRCVEFRYSTWGRKSFFEVEKDLARFLRQEKAVGVVGYSQGGTLAIGATHKLPVFSLGATLRGTLTAYLYNSVGFRQIRYKTNYITHVVSQIPRHSILSVYTPFDTITIPFTSSLAGENIRILCPLHQFICFWPRTQRFYRRWLLTL